MTQNIRIHALFFAVIVLAWVLTETVTLLVTGGLFDTPLYDIASVALSRQMVPAVVVTLALLVLNGRHRTIRLGQSFVMDFVAFLLANIFFLRAPILGLVVCGLLTLVFRRIVRAPEWVHGLLTGAVFALYAGLLLSRVLRML